MMMRRVAVVRTRSTTCGALAACSTSSRSAVLLREPRQGRAALFATTTSTPADGSQRRGRKRSEAQQAVQAKTGRTSAAPKRFEGFTAATLTPMDRNATPALGLIKEYAQKLNKDGCSGVFVCGTSGESMSLSVPERKAALEEWIKHKGNLNVIAQIGTTSLEQTRDLAAHAEGAGADGIATMAPFFFKPTETGVLVDFCASVAQAAPKTPFFYYHYPAITGVNIPVYDFFEKAHGVIPTLRGAKFTGTELGDYYRALRFQDGLYDILMGFEYMHLPCLPLGSKGGISLSFSFCAPVYRQLFDAYKQNDVAKAQKIQLVIAEFMNVLAQHGFVPSAKALMKEWYGLDMGPCRLPLQKLSKAQATSFLSHNAVQNLRSLLPTQM